MGLQVVTGGQPRVFVGREGDPGGRGHLLVQGGVPDVQGLLRLQPELGENFFEALRVRFGPGDIVGRDGQIEEVIQAQCSGAPGAGFCPGWWRWRSGSGTAAG